MKFVKEIFMSIRERLIRLLMIPCDIITGLLWYSDKYKGFLHWLSINAYEWYWSLDQLLIDVCGVIPETKSCECNPKLTITAARMPRHF